MKKENKSSISFAQECILDALIILANEKDLYSITISELCNKAGVSRMSFYRNYSTINDIIESHLVDILDEYKRDEMDSKTNESRPERLYHIETYFNFLYHHRNFIDILIKHGIDTVFLNKQTEYMIEKYTDNNDILFMTSLAGAIYNLFRYWSLNGYTIEKKEIINSLISVYFPDSISST